VEVLQAKIILDEKIVIEQNALLGKECSTKKEKKRTFGRTKIFGSHHGPRMQCIITSHQLTMLPSISG
jgi:hypothetical protein